MTVPSLRRLTAAAVPLGLNVALAATLSGCVSFGAKPPPTFMALTSSQPPAPTAGGIVPENSALTVFTPTYPQELASARVPVRTGPTQVAYIKGAQWEDVPAKLFRALLADTISARTGRLTLEPRDYHVAPGPRLSGKLSTFGLDEASRSAVVTFDAMIERDGKPLETRRFQSKVPAAMDADGARAGLNQAANDVATQVADWIGPAGAP